MSRPAGLDMGVLLGLRKSGRDLAAIKDAIAEHLREHAGYLAFSGGKDSLVVLHLALQVDPTIPVVFFDSGLEYPQTYAYIGELAERWDLNLSVYRATPSLLQVLASQPSWSGTPGHDHFPLPLGQLLIDEPASRAHADFGAGELWGVRAGEAHGRAMAYLAGSRTAACSHEPACAEKERPARHGGQIHRADGTRVLGPIWQWSTAEVWGYIARHDLPAHPAYATLEALGVPLERRRISHLLDAAMLDRGAAMLLARGWPALFNELAEVLPMIRQYT